MSSVAAFVNFGLFQVAWFTAVYGATTDQVILGSLPGCVAALWHIIDLRQRNRWEAGLIAAVLCVGIATELSFIYLGAITYIGMEAGQIFPPFWILSMWLAFATLPHGCLSWLTGRLWTQAFLGAVGGPICYLIGASLGAAILPDPPLYTILVIGSGWALALPMVFLLADSIRDRRDLELASAY